MRSCNSCLFVLWNSLGDTYNGSRCLTLLSQGSDNEDFLILWKVTAVWNFVLAITLSIALIVLSIGSDEDDCLFKKSVVYEQELKCPECGNLCTHIGTTCKSKEHIYMCEECKDQRCETKVTYTDCCTRALEGSRITFVVRAGLGCCRDWRCCS